MVHSVILYTSVIKSTKRSVLYIVTVLSIFDGFTSLLQVP